MDFLARTQKFAILDAIAGPSEKLSENGGVKAYSNFWKFLEIVTESALFYSCGP